MVRPVFPNRQPIPRLFTRREALRLGSLLLALLMVGFLIREFSRPRFMAQVDHVMGIAPQLSAADDLEPASALPPIPATSDSRKFQELLEMAGWTEARFAKLAVANDLTNDSQIELIELLRRLQTFDTYRLTQWAKPATDNEIAPGDLIQFAGQVILAKRHEVPANLAARLEMSEYYECELQLAGTLGKATVLTARIPSTWLQMERLDQTAAAAGVFVRRLPTAAAANGTEANRLFVSREIAWHPVSPLRPYVSLGKSLLGPLGVDVGLFDLVRQRSALTGNDRELFYQVLRATGQIGVNQLFRLAMQDLPAVHDHWQAEEKRLAALAKTTGTQFTAKDRASLQLSREILARASQDKTSVAPLFNSPSSQVGELSAFEGTARRVTRIELAADSDVARRFGITQYFEVDVFTDDSQNNPLVFCLRELPLGFPIGDRLHEHVKVAGFFLKSWSFQSQRATLPANEDEPANQEIRQVAPLLIGRGLLWVTSTTAEGTTGSPGIVLAGVFVVLLSAFWAAGWWLARDDRRFVQTTLANQFSLANGESLNDLDFDLSPGPKEYE